MEVFGLSDVWSGREDSNLRPPAPKAGALTRLRYAPTQKKKVQLENWTCKFWLPGTDSNRRQGD